MRLCIHLLLIEDSQADTLLLVKTLKSQGIDSVYECVHEAQALKVLLEKKRWEIILSDYQMPKFTGLEALQICKEKAPDTPFIMVTGAIGEETAAHVMKAGAVDFILKSNLSRLGSIIERELREAAIRKRNQELEQEFKAVFDTTMDALLVVNEKGEYLRANPAAYKLLGCSNNHIEKSIQELFCGNDISAFQTLWRNFLEKLYIHGELPLICENKEKRYVEFRAIANFLKGKHLFVLQDISSRKQAQEALEELNKKLEQRVIERTSELAKVNVALSVEINERKQAEWTLKEALIREQLLRKIQKISETFELRSLLENASKEIREHFRADRCIFFVCDPQISTQIYVNHQNISKSSIQIIDSQDILYSTGQFEENTKSSSQIPSIQISDNKNIPQSLKSFANKYNVRSILTAQITYQTTLYGAIVLHQCEEERLWDSCEITLMNDIATILATGLHQIKLYEQEQQAKQEAEKANRQKTRILGYVAHDFKNPLNGMKWVLDHFKGQGGQNLTQHQQEALSHFDLAVQQLHSMVTDILDKARLDEGKLTLNPQILEVSTFLSNLEILLCSTVAEKKVTLNLNIPKQIKYIKADPVYLRQILLNLLSNAIKYNKPEGSVILSLKESLDKRWLEWEVKDSGIGISNKQLEKLFEDYYRVDYLGNKKANSIEGTGLGLSYVKKLVDLHQGEIFVESIIGKGSSFLVKLPMMILPIALESVKNESRLLNTFQFTEDILKTK